MSITLPSEYPGIFGQSFQKRNSGAIVTVGNHSWTRYDLGLMGCPHTNAARQMDRMLKELGVKNMTDVVTRFSPLDFTVKGCGVTQFYVLTCLIRDSGLSLKQFYREKVTFDTLKHQHQGTSRSKKRRRVA